MRSVRFAESDIVIEITHINDMSDEEIHDVYMSDEELQAVRTECKTFVRMMDEGAHIGKDGIEIFCTRGLDQHTNSHTSMAREIRDNIYDAVYTAQCFYEASHSPVVVETLIATLCQRFSSIHAAQAHATGKADSRAARRHSHSSRTSQHRQHRSSHYQKNESKKQQSHSSSGHISTHKKKSSSSKKLYSPSRRLPHGVQHHVVLKNDAIQRIPVGAILSKHGGDSKDDSSSSEFRVTYIHDPNEPRRFAQEVCHGNPTEMFRKMQIDPVVRAK